MQVIAAAAPASRTDRLAVARSALAGLLMVVVGSMLAWICVTTPFITSFVPDGRPSTTQMAAGIVAWGFAIIVPAGFLLIGFARLLATLEAIAAMRPHSVTPRLAKALGADHLAATNLVLPGGRRINELVVGPFGIVVLGDVPPAQLSRHVGSSWEVRGPRGRWLPVESPVIRAARDAERVRGWLSTDDRDFLVKVYAALVTDDERVERIPTCAVVPTAGLAGWLEGLPPQRGLNADRRERLLELIRSVATRG
jgi:hypothetical protein